MCTELFLEKSYSTQGYFSSCWRCLSHMSVHVNMSVHHQWWKWKIRVRVMVTHKLSIQTNLRVQRSKLLRFGGFTFNVKPHCKMITNLVHFLTNESRSPCKGLSEFDIPWYLWSAVIHILFSLVAACKIFTAIRKEIHFMNSYLFLNVKWQN